MKRLLTAIISIALLGLTPLALTSAATAATGDSVETVPGASAPTAGEFDTFAKQRRYVTAKGQDKGNKLFLKGRVSPEYANSKVQIKRSSRAKRGYSTWKTVKTNQKGYFSARIVAPNRVGPSYYYYAFVDNRGDYRAARSQGYTRTFRSF